MNPYFSVDSDLIHIKAYIHSTHFTMALQTACGQSRTVHMGFKNPTPRFQDLEPIKRPLTASFNSNINIALKQRIKPKYGETPTFRSLSKLLKSGTHAKPSPRREAFLLVPKTADSRIVQKLRENEDTLSLENQI